MNPYRLKAYFYLILVVLIWGIAGPVIKLVLNDVPWEITLLYRFAISSLVFIPFIKIRDFKHLIDKKVLTLTFLYTFLGTSVGLGLLFAGTAKTSLVSMSLLSLFAPILTILGGYFFLKERITWMEKFGIGVTFLGSLLIIIEPVIRFDGVKGEFLGDILVIGSLISGVIAAIILKELLRKGISPLFLANLDFLVGFISMIPVVLLLHSPSETFSIISKLSLPLHIGIWYIAVFSGTIAYWLYNVAQKSIEVSEQAVFSYLHPILSAVLAVWLLSEPMTPLSYFGSGITIVGIVIAEVKRRTKKSGKRK